jgi:hypothetical protein
MQAIFDVKGVLYRIVAEYWTSGFFALQGWKEGLYTMVYAVAGLQVD